MSGGGGGGGGSQVVGYRYYFGIHMGLGRGPVDELCEIKVGDRTAWSGSVSNNTSFAINNANLFGGERKDGGIDGTFDVMMGGPSQTASAGVRSLFRVDVPATITVSGSTNADGVYTRVEDGTATPIYTAVIATKTWTCQRDSFGRWTISESANVYRTTDTPTTPENAAGWASVAYVQAGWDYETQSPSYVESVTYVPGMSVSASYSVIPGFRRMLTVFFDGLIAANNPYPKPWKFRVRRVTSGWDGAVWQPGLATVVMNGDIKAMNPAHIIYECLTNRDWGRGMARELIDDTSFTAAATTLATEGFGMCIRWSRTDSIESFVQSVIDHIGASLFQSRRTGLMTLRLIRGGYDINTLPHFTPETGLLSVTDSAVATLGNNINEIEVTYRDPKSNEDRTVKVSNLASLQINNGSIISAKRSYPGVPTAELATRLAQRDLKVGALPLRKFNFTLDRRGRSVEPGAVILVSDPVRGIYPTPVRVAQVEDGTLTNGQINVVGLQDVFELPLVSWSVPVGNTWIPPDTNACLDVHKVFEIPYFVLAGHLRRADLAYVEPDDGYLGAVCARGKDLNAGYRVAIRAGASTPEDAPDTSDFFCGYTP